MVLDFIAKEIPEIKVVEKEATYLFWLDVRGLKNEGKGFAKELRLTTGLYLTDGREYGKSGQGFVRMNIACTKKNLIDGLNRLKTGVRLWEDSSQADNAISEAEKEFAEGGVLIDAREALSSLRRKYFE